jgi:hypothetical protein
MLNSVNATLAQAQSAQPPAAPLLITSHAQLIAKVVIVKNANTVTSLQSAFDVQFNLATPQNHNDLGGLNDGDSYEHLTSDEKTIAAYNLLKDIIPFIQ